MSTQLVINHRPVRQDENVMILEEQRKKMDSENMSPNIHQEQEEANGNTQDVQKLKKLALYKKAKIHIISQSSSSSSEMPAGLSQQRKILQRILQEEPLNLEQVTIIFSQVYTEFGSSNFDKRQMQVTYDALFDSVLHLQKVKKEHQELASTYPSLLCEGGGSARLFNEAGLHLSLLTEQKMITQEAKKLLQALENAENERETIKKKKKETKEQKSSGEPSEDLERLISSIGEPSEAFLDRFIREEVDDTEPGSTVFGYAQEEARLVAELADFILGREVEALCLEMNAIEEQREKRQSNR